MAKKFFNFSTIWKKFFSAPILIPVVIIIIYFFTHLLSLTALPVFADESIYIRWTQLIIDDWKQYLFFALNDGKTPLFIWLLVPFQFLFQDQLFAARVVSVFIGALQLLAIQALVRVYGGRPKTQWLAVALTTILPYWFFHHRIALMDGMLTVLLSMTVLGLTHLTLSISKPKKEVIGWWLFISLSFGVALWTKLPALFLLPTLILFPFLTRPFSLRKCVTVLGLTGSALFMGLCIFVVLRLSPAFGQLFSRGQDFTFPLAEVLFQGRWKQTLSNIPSYLSYFVTYLTWPIMVFAVSGIFSNATRRKNIILLLIAIIFCGPFVLLGKVIYARYLFPAVPFITVASVLSPQAFYTRYYLKENALWIKTTIALIIATLMATIVSSAGVFITKAWFSPDELPLVQSDRVQYLEEWSSGHGITQAVAFIREQAKDHTVAVATEGRFGTLPDALLMYFHRTDLRNIYIEGIGQHPVKYFPKFFVEKAQKQEKSYLVVNSHRRGIPLPPEQFIAEFCRPNNAPCLQIWDVTPQIRMAAQNKK